LDGLPSPNPARLLRNYQALTNPQPVRYLLPLVAPRESADGQVDRRVGAMGPGDNEED
jgi:hypothetical protein